MRRIMQERCMLRTDAVSASISNAMSTKFDPQGATQKRASRRNQVSELAMNRDTRSRRGCLRWRYASPRGDSPQAEVLQLQWNSPVDRRATQPRSTLENWCPPPHLVGATGRCSSDIALLTAEHSRSRDTVSATSTEPDAWVDRVNLCVLR
jgi:hypothetical protein